MQAGSLMNSKCLNFARLPSLAFLYTIIYFAHLFRCFHSPQTWSWKQSSIFCFTKKLVLHLFIYFSILRRFVVKQCFIIRNLWNIFAKLCSSVKFSFILQKLHFHLKKHKLFNTCLNSSSNILSAFCLFYFCNVFYPPFISCATKSFSFT